MLYYELSISGLTCVPKKEVARGDLFHGIWTGFDSTIIPSLRGKDIFEFCMMKIQNLANFVLVAMFLVYGDTQNVVDT